jgi:hypothetical protein
VGVVWSPRLAIWPKSHFFWFFFFFFQILISFYFLNTIFFFIISDTCHDIIDIDIAQ